MKSPEEIEKFLKERINFLRTLKSVSEERGDIFMASKQGKAIQTYQDVLSFINN